MLDLSIWRLELILNINIYLKNNLINNIFLEYSDNMIKILYLGNIIQLVSWIELIPIDIWNNENLVLTILCLIIIY